MVPFDRALPSSYRLPTETILVTVCLQCKFWLGFPTRKFPIPACIVCHKHTDTLSLSNTMFIVTTWASPPNDISFRPTALAGCTSVTDRQSLSAMPPKINLYESGSFLYKIAGGLVVPNCGLRHTIQTSIVMSTWSYRFSHTASMKKYLIKNWNVTLYMQQVIIYKPNHFILINHCTKLREVKSLCSR